MTHPARLRFCGAARGVTGSCYHLETDDGAIVVDCGVFQGGDNPDAMNRAAFPFEPSAVHAVILTHGHLDHVGRLPLLGRNGFDGPVLGHPATLEVAKLIMDDTAKIGLYSGVKALYTDADVNKVTSRVRPIKYGEEVQVGPFTVELFDAGHILGSSSARIAWKEGGADRAILFSGDIGTHGAPILRDPYHDWVPDEHAVDFVVTESTYGDRTHPIREKARQAFREAILHAVSDGGKVLIPAFAIGRTQEVLYDLNILVESGQLPGVPVVVDGPLGLDATQLYQRYHDCYDCEARALLQSGDKPLEFMDLYSSRKANASDSIGGIDGPAIIIAGSGMCNGGRIVKHLADWLPDPRTDVIFVGYQAGHTLGRDLQQGKSEVVIEGKTVPVRAHITTISGFSAHADRDALASWYAKVPLRKGGAVFVTHGEEKASRGYAKHLKDKHAARAIVPKLGDQAALIPRA
jgi:metallo-beta-lactamase family protein